MIGLVVLLRSCVLRIIIMSLTVAFVVPPPYRRPRRTPARRRGLSPPFISSNEVGVMQGFKLARALWASAFAGALLLLTVAPAWGQATGQIQGPVYFASLSCL